MLSAHFSLAEFTTTQIRGVDNTPSAEVIEHLEVTARQMERIREFLAHPIIVTSGYRSPEVNRRVGGSPTSAHIQGWAVDFLSPRFGTPLAVCQALQKSDILVDQLIYEGNWVHCSFRPLLRKHMLTAHFSNGGTTYTDGFG